MPRTPYINIWNPICKKFQWVRIVNIFKHYEKNNYYYAVDVLENNFCKCNLNKYMLISDDYVYRYHIESKYNNWINKNKSDLKDYNKDDLVELYNYAKKTEPRYIRFDAPNITCQLDSKTKNEVSLNLTSNMLYNMLYNNIFNRSDSKIFLGRWGYHWEKNKETQKYYD